MNAQRLRTLVLIAATVLPGVAGAADGTELAALPRGPRGGAPLPSPESLQARFERLASLAESSLVVGQTQVAENAWFRVACDLPQRDVAEKVAVNLAATWAVLDGVFGPRPPDPAAGRKVRVYLYSSRDQYAQLSRKAAGASFSKAFYSSPGLIALHAEAFSREDLLSTLLHEGVHAYVDRFVARPGRPLPSWLNEGLAEYLASSEVRDGKLVPGVSRPIRTYHSPHGVFRGKSRQRSAAILVRRALREGRAIPLAELVEAPPGEFYGPSRSVAYHQSSLLVHFLRHGRPGWKTEAFPVLVRAAAEGRPIAEAFRAGYGTAPGGLERDFRRYVKSL